MTVVVRRGHNPPNGRYTIVPPHKEDWTDGVHHHGNDVTSDAVTTKPSMVQAVRPPAPPRTAPPSNDGAMFMDQPRVSVLMELTDRMGILHDVLKYFWKYDINVTRIESRPVALSSSSSSGSSSWGGGGTTSAAMKQPKFDFYMDFVGSLEDLAVQKLLHDLAPFTEKLLLLDEKDVHWFPRHISELDAIAHRTLDAGVDLESDHPGFRDPKYRERRAVLARNALQHTWDRPIPFIEYTNEEKETWGTVWDRMEDLWKKYACKEFLVRRQWYYGISHLSFWF
jgi:hypothetical protein